MKRSFMLLTAGALMGFIAAPAQQATNDANPMYRPASVRISTIVVPPIPGVPFSATAIIENKQLMPDGTTAASRNINLIARDSRGRTYGEMRSRVPADSPATPRLSEAHIFDPQTDIVTIYYPARLVATRQQRPRPRQSALSQPNPDQMSASPNPPGVQAVDLGATTIDGIDVKGTRRTTVVPAQISGTGAPVTVVDEYWYSEDLHLNILLLHNDPRTGQQTIGLSGIKREEPPPSLFEIPAGYKIVDMTPPAGAPAPQINH